ncbi:MAG: glycosyl transferase family 2 [Phycisphaerae bacterium]|nr:glycosyl transferase family 2 [Phycisphaerae bacterium]
MQVAVVIVNYRVATLTIEAIDSLLADPSFEGDIVVVDNVSPDDSAAVLSAAFADPRRNERCTLVPSDRNGGFAYGNNVGIRHLLERPSPPDAFHLLNPDTIAHPRATSALAEAASADPRVGVVGSHLEGADGERQAAAFRFPSCPGEFERGAMTGPISKLLRSHVVSLDALDHATDVDWVSGASFLVTRKLIEDVGLMDDGFFLYYEEVEMCWRAKHAGYRVRYEPASRVVHLEGQSTTDPNASTQPKRSPHWYNSRRRYFERTVNEAHADLCDATLLAGAAVRAARDARRGGFDAWRELRRSLAAAKKHTAERREPTP